MANNDSSTNFGAFAEDYASFRVAFPDSLFDRLSGLGLRFDGKDLVDIGTGTGALARGFARRGARVTAIDPDERMLEQARQLDSIAGVDIEYRTGKAEEVPLADSVANVVSAGQCWHWFDGPAAAREIARITRPGGRVVVANFDWLTEPGSVVQATEELILKHNPKWHLGGGDGFHPESESPLRAAGFVAFESFSYEVKVEFTHESWRGRIRSNSGVGASLPPIKVTEFDAELASLLQNKFPGPVLEIQHRLFAIVGTLGTGRG